MKLVDLARALVLAALISLAHLGPIQAVAHAQAPAPKAPAAAKETVENPYGLEALWKQGDFVSKGTLIILVIMSMGSWYIMFVKVYEQFKLFRQAKEIMAGFWSAASVQEAASGLKEGSPFRYVAESGLKATAHHEGKLLEQIDLNTWVTMSIQRATLTQKPEAQSRR